MTKGEGFTLLELMVVLVILGGVSALATPNLIKLKSSWERQLAIKDILNQVSRLGAWSRNQQQSVTITKTTFYPPHAVDLPDDWVVTAKNKLIWLDNGVCLGGQLVVSNNEVERVFILSAPFCQPVSL